MDLHPPAQPLSHTLTKEDKIDILQRLLEQFLPDTPLKLHQTLCGIDRDNYTSGHYYQILGNPYRKKTQITNLQYKVKDCHQQAFIFPNKPPKAALRDDGQEDRYFKPHIKCFRCKQFGHYALNCFRQSNFCCHCLCVEHPSEMCPQRIICFRCYEIGHISNMCQGGEGPLCEVCGRRHWGDCGFLCRGYDNIKQIIVRSGSEMEEVVCMVCEELGHYNCQLYFSPNP